MKKNCVIVLCLILIAASTSCAAKQRETSAPATIANPVVELDAPDFVQAGFKVTEYPTGYKLTRCAEIDGRIGEMEFNLDDGSTMIFRVSKQTDEDISGMYYEFTKETNYDSKNVPITIKEVFEPSYTAVCTWNKGGYTFSLSIQALEEPVGLFTLAENFAEHIVMEPEQL